MTVTHHTDAHLAHGTSRTSSFFRGFFASLPFFFALSYPGMFTLAGGGIPIRRSTVECSGCFLLYAFFPQHLFKNHDVILIARTEIKRNSRAHGHPERLGHPSVLAGCAGFHRGFGLVLGVGGYADLVRVGSGLAGG